MTSGARAVRFLLTGGQRHDVTQAAALIAGLKPGYVIADRAYDSAEFRKQLRRQKAKAAIPSPKNRKIKRRPNKARYARRNVVERFFGRIKHFRRVATRYDKKDVNYLGFVLLASVIVTPLPVVHTT